MRVLTGGQSCRDLHNSPGQTDLRNSSLQSHHIFLSESMSLRESRSSQRMVSCVRPVRRSPEDTRAQRTQSIQEDLLRTGLILGKQGILRRTNRSCGRIPRPQSIVSHLDKQLSEPTISVPTRRYAGSMIYAHHRQENRRLPLMRWSARSLATTPLVGFPAPYVALPGGRRVDSRLAWWDASSADKLTTRSELLETSWNPMNGMLIWGAKRFSSKEKTEPWD